MHRTTIWRKVKKFRTVFGEHPDTFVFEGITIDHERIWQELLSDPEKH